MSNGMKKKSSKVIDRYLMDIGVDKEEMKRILRNHRLKSLAKEDQGLVHWEEWCEEQGWDIMPTLDTLLQFSEGFIVPMEEKSKRRLSIDPTAEPLCGTKSFILPLMRLRKRLLQEEEQQDQQIQRMQLGRNEVLEVLEGGDAEYSDLEEPRGPTATGSNGLDHNHEKFTVQGRGPSLLKETPSVTGIQSGAASSSTVKTTDPQKARDQEKPLQKETWDTFVHSDSDPSYLEDVVHAVGVADGRSQRSSFKAEEFQLLKKGSGGKRKRMVNAPVYPLHHEVLTVEDALQEWRYGFRGGPAIQDLNGRYGVHWRRPTDWSAYTARTAVVKEYTVLVKEEGYTSEQAIAKLNIEQGPSSLGTLRLRITARRNAGGKKKHTDIQELHEDAADDAFNPLRDDDEGFTEDDDSADETYTANNRKKIAPALEEDAAEPFPFPIRHLNSISDIWQEWVKGWEGEESFESLMQTHGKIWGKKQFWNEHNNYFYSRWRIVSTIKEAFQTGAVATTTEAIQAMEKAREFNNTSASEFILSPGFKDLTVQWREKGRKESSYNDA
ncbi:hypothetical protein EMPS_03868 [Entomortierella parvispora]|uniref:Transcription activator GCR1-like domain-containing protein n=1 Tax=Entomortierella parvispora TaxID=205924 RepID=A0A9P3H823_9FUNG|nr:hypothetical protein EMPS_03868 [Entomortierella parvispora]